MNKISLFIRLTRWNEWILGVGCIFLGYLLPVPPSISYSILFALIAAFILTHSFGFAINDCYDADFDRLKPETRNVISNNLLKKSHAAVFCILLLVAGLSLSLFYLNIFSFSVIAMIYFIFFVYSAKPFRLKEKRFAGIAAHGLFTSLLVVAAYSSLDMRVLIFSVSVFILSVMAGLTQEIRDVEADKKSGFKTTGMFLDYKKGLQSLKLLIVSAVVITGLGIILYIPAFMFILLAGSIFYLKFIFSNPPQEIFFAGTMEAWKKGMATIFMLALIVVPFYMKWFTI